MMQKDYILRMIEQLGKFLAKTMALKKAEKPEAALPLLETACSTFLGIDTTLLEALPVQDIGELFGVSKDGFAGGMKSIIAARLLREKLYMQSQSRAGVDKAALPARLLKALTLYLNGMLAAGHCEIDLSSYYADASRIAEQLGNSLPSEVMVKVFKMHLLFNDRERAGRWLRISKAAELNAEEDSDIFFH